LLGDPPGVCVSGDHVFKALAAPADSAKKKFTFEQLSENAYANAVAALTDDAQTTPVTALQG
jgi:hypothetical protein